MELAELKHVLLDRPGTTEEIPFGPEALVYKVMGKMFAIVDWQGDPLHITLKCDPDQAMFLRDLYPAVKPGYHTNKIHWNTVELDGSVPYAELRGMIDDSYALVVKSLTRKQREELETLGRSS